jgi:hypothetical protein
MYYGETGQIIINTEDGDIVLHVFIDFCEHLKVGDIVCPVEWVDGSDPKEPEIRNAKWLQSIENYVNKINDDLQLHKILVGASIKIESRILDTTTLTLFGKVDDWYMKELDAYLSGI